MYIWTGLMLDKADEADIRAHCYPICEKHALGTRPFLMPQHISLKISFESENYTEVAQYMKELIENCLPITVTATGISKIDGSVAWIDIEKTEKLFAIHKMLNEKLGEKYGIPLGIFDGDIFAFHSTLFLSERVSSALEDDLKKLEKQLSLPRVFEIREIGIAISDSPEFNTYKMIETVK